MLAHELGHWALGHTPRLLAAAQVQILGQLALFTALRASPTLASSFGFDPVTSPPFIAFVLFQYLSGPLDEVRGGRGPGGKLWEWGKEGKLKTSREPGARRLCESGVGCILSLSKQQGKLQ